MNISVNLTKRLTTPEGQRFFPVVGANSGRVKPDWVCTDGKEVRCPKGTYYIDGTDSSGKRSEPPWGQSRQKRKLRVFDGV